MTNIIRELFAAKAAAATAPWPKMAGKPYRPSSGTEGMAFDDVWCSRCARDAAYRDAGEDADPALACPILSATFIYMLDDPEYPAEWVHDRDGRPCCTAFTADPSCPVRCDKTKDMFEPNP